MKAGLLCSSRVVRIICELVVPTRQTCGYLSARISPSPIREVVSTMNSSWIKTRRSLLFEKRPIKAACSTSAISSAWSVILWSMAFIKAFFLPPGNGITLPCHHAVGFIVLLSTHPPGDAAASPYSSSKSSRSIGLRTSLLSEVGTFLPVPITEACFPSQITELYGRSNHPNIQLPLPLGRTTKVVGWAHERCESRQESPSFLVPYDSDRILYRSYTRVVKSI